MKEYAHAKETINKATIIVNLLLLMLILLSETVIKIDAVIAIKHAISIFLLPICIINLADMNYI